MFTPSVRDTDTPPSGWQMTSYVVISNDRHHPAQFSVPAAVASTAASLYCRRRLFSVVFRVTALAYTSLRA